MRFSPIARFCLVAAGALGLWTGSAFCAARAQTPGAAVIVFDGSGSMWGELAGDKSQKLQMARDALHAQFLKMPVGARAGLVSFGHRRKGNCSDVEVIAAPEPGAPDRLTSPLDKIDPKGKGPLTLAMREAHKLLSSDPNGTIIVIFDGPDNCGQDPCAVAAEIAKVSPKIVIHTIGLSLEKPDAQRLSCIAKLTSGRAFDVQDAAGTTSAIAESMKLANLNTGLEAPQSSQGTTVQAPNPPPAQSQKGEPGLNLSASLAEGDPVITAPLRWRVFRDGAQDTPIIEKTAPQISEILPPGKYAIEAHYGLALARGPVEVGEDGPTTVRVPLNAGILKFAALSTKGRDPLSEALLTLWRKTPSKTAEGEAILLEPIWMARGGENEVVIPEGSYTARMDVGLAHPEREANIVAGGRAVVEFNLGLGRIELAASVSEGGPAASDVSFIIAEDDPDAPQGRREIARSAHPEPSFSLPAGTYYVTAKTPSTEVRQRIALGVGDTVKRSLVVGLTRLEVIALMEQGPMPPNTLIAHRVSRLDGEPGEVARETGSPASFLLAAGRYRIESTLGSENVKVTTDVELQPGREVKTTAKMQAARVMIKGMGANASAGAGKNGSWEIRDARGGVIWRSASADPMTVLLAPGRYVLRSDITGQRADRPFEVKSGETRTLDTGAP